MPLSNFKLTFRRKLLLALIGTIAPLLLVTLLVVRREANQQVEQVVQATTERAGEAFARVERLRQRQLQQLGWRIANSNRWYAAMQQALEGDTALVMEQTRYELEIAGFQQALALFANMSGETLTGVARGARLQDNSAAVSANAVDRLFAGDTAVFGYQIINRELYSVHPTFVEIDPEVGPAGIVLLGFAVDDETAASLGSALGADVCFFADARCMATSHNAPKANLERLAAESRDGIVQRVNDGDKPYALVKQQLPGAAEANTFFVLRIPLAAIIGPFDTIQDAIRVVGLVMLLIAALLALFLSRGLARPVRELVAATTRVAAGDYEATVTVRSRDELGTLAAAFNDMTHGLLLKERYKGVLDKVVSRDVADEMLKGEIKLGGETREVTTLFADVRGFTPLTESMEPQEVIKLLNSIMEGAEAAIVDEGGVVDKYVGDEIMALFGAPMSRGDDALRAVRAAIRMQQSVDELNKQRAEHGGGALALGIGINTGDVVAGNMGSPRRLNYTVLGGAVNLAARLCSEAKAGQILISEMTLQQIRDRVETRELGSRNIKGFSRPISVHEVMRAVPAGLLAIFFATTLSAQQLQPSVRIDATAFVPANNPAWLIEETAPFIAGRASLFLDAFVRDHIYGLAELRVDRGATPSDRGIDARIEQLFVRWSPFNDFDANLQAGRFVSPFGNFPQRHDSPTHAFIRPPLNYDYRTVISSTSLPGTNDGFFGWKNEPDIRRPHGAPAVWAAPYQLGAMLFGSVRMVSFRAAVMNSAPSSEPDQWNRMVSDGLSFVGHAAIQVSPELRAGVSYNRGAYLADEAMSGFIQQLIGAELTVTRGFVEVRAELLHDTWEVPRVIDNLVDVSYYLEGKFKLRPGLFGALRFGEMRFREAQRSNGSSEVWDYNVRRIQLAGGYQITEQIGIRGEYMFNQTDGPIDPDDNLLSMQMTWSFGR